MVKYEVSYRFPIEKIPVSRQMEVSCIQQTGFFLKNPVFPKNLCFRSMESWCHMAGFIGTEGQKGGFLAGQHRQKRTHPR